MMPRSTRRKLWVLASAIIVIGLLVVGMFLKQLRHPGLRFPYLNEPLPLDEHQALLTTPGWSEVSLAVEPGVRVRAMVRAASKKGAPWLLFYPGNDQRQLRMGLEFLNELAQQEDLGLVALSYRGFDGSEGEPQLLQLSTDAPQALLSVINKFSLSPSQVHVIGFSIGGYFAAHAVRSSVDARRGEHLASLTLLASVNDIFMVRRSWWQRLDRGDHYRTQPLLAQVPAPVLVVQGTEDEALRGPLQGRAIANALGAKARYVELSGVGHSALLKNPAALAEVREFIRKTEPAIAR